MPVINAEWPPSLQCRRTDHTRQLDRRGCTCRVYRNARGARYEVCVMPTYPPLLLPSGRTYKAVVQYFANARALVEQDQRNATIERGH